MATRLTNLFVKNVAAVGKPANKRSFLVIKSAVKKDDEAITFDDAMFGRRVCKVYEALGARYSALMETIDSIRYSKDEGKPDAVKAAVTSFMESMTAAMPGMLAEMDDDVEKSTFDPATLSTLRDKIDTIIKEYTMADEVKKGTAPDATALTRLGQSIAALFGRAAGADETVVAALEKSAAGTPVVEIDPAITARLQKSEDEAAELRKSNDELAKTVAKLNEDAELRKFAEEVAGYKNIGLDPAKDAALLKSVSENLTKDQADRFREILKSAMALAQAQSLFREVGSSASGAASGSVEEEINQKTASMMAEMRKSDDKVTAEQARDKVFRANPGLYERYSAETTLKV